MEETVSSRLEPDMAQKSLCHCSANTMTDSDLGAGLPKSVQGGSGAREVRERLHGHLSTILPKSLDPSDGTMNHGWATSRLGPGLFFPTPIPSVNASSHGTKMTNLLFIYLKRFGEMAWGGGGGGGMKWSNQYRLCSSCPAAALSWQILITGRQEYKDRLVNGLSWFHTQQQGKNNDHLILCNHWLVLPGHDDLLNSQILENISVVVLSLHFFSHRSPKWCSFVIRFF